MEIGIIPQINGQVRMNNAIFLVFKIPLLLVLFGGSGGGILSGGSLKALPVSPLVPSSPICLCMKAV